MRLLLNNKVANALEISSLSFRYDKAEVLTDINLTLPMGTFLGIVGPNGSGKSTLVKLILGLLKVKDGHIKLFGTEIQHFKDWKKIGFVSQKANSFNSGFPATVYEVVSMGLVSQIGLFKFLTKADKQKVLHAIETVGMKDYLNRNIGELSGGQQQRVFIARAIVSNPELLILDEPTVGVDVNNVENFYQILDKLNNEHKITLVLITHDIGTITKHASHVACLNKTLQFHGKASVLEGLDESDLSSFYGHSLQIINHDH